MAKWPNANFILGSVAEVERLWSTADRVLDGKRNRTTPLLFEAFLFLKYNKKYWDFNLFVEAWNMQVNKRWSERMRE